MAIAIPRRAAAAALFSAWPLLLAGCGFSGAAAAQIEETAAAMTAAALPGRNGTRRWSFAMQYQQRYPLVAGDGVLQLMPERVQQPGWAHAAQEAEETQLTIEFRPRSATAELRDWGALRVQLSSQGSLSMRPRRGGLQVSWRATF